MKKILIPIVAVAVVFTIFTACETQKVVVNRQVDTTKDGKMLLGKQTKSQFLQEPYSEWYNKEMTEYAIDEKTVAELKKAKLNSYSITVIMGTWCEDSHREVPRLMKILDAVSYPEQKLEIIAVNRKKESPGGEEGLYNIQKVPTIIVSKYGKEIGRIIEAPKSGWLEKDLLEIVKKDDTSFKDIFK